MSTFDAAEITQIKAPIVIIQNNHSLIDAIRCKTDNNDVSNKTIKKITSKLESAKNTSDIMNSGALKELRMEIDNIKGEKARSKLDKALDKFEMKNVHLRFESQIALLNMSLKISIKDQVKESNTCRDLTSQIGEIATHGQNNIEARESCYQTLSKANMLINKGDIDNLKLVLKEAASNIYN